MTGLSPEPEVTGQYAVITDIAWFCGPMMVEVTNLLKGLGGLWASLLTTRGPNHWQTPPASEVGYAHEEEAWMWYVL